MSFWLTYPDSLTLKLKEIAGDVYLHVLREQWEAADPWDKERLLVDNKLVYHREIVMYAMQLACWYARTTISEETYHANEMLFSRLKHQSLGDIIYHEPTIERTNLKAYVIDQNMDEYHWVKSLISVHEEPLWARYSSFLVQKKYPFHLIEILLPDLGRFEL